MTPKEASEIYKNKVPFSHGKRGIVSKSSDGKYLIKERKKESTSPGTIRNEYEYNLKLNKINVGPKVHYYDDKNDFLMRDFINGENIFEYFSLLEKEASREVLKKEILRIILNIFEQCRKMDNAQINKFEMTNPYKDLIIDEKTKLPVLIDFERCRHSEKPKNITQFCQFLIKSNMKKEFEKVEVHLDEKRIISLAEEYKREQSEENYEKIVDEIEKNFR
jgi:putative serine/threonine protein kinase